jgi:3-deoxy-7-phosphoheptulonate synthase
MMMVVMEGGATVSEVSAVIRSLEGLGLTPRPSHGASQTVIGVIGAEDGEQLAAVARMAGVAQVSPVNDAFKLVNREFQQEPTVVRAGSVRIGSAEVVVMAGPCSVEAPEQMKAAAAAVRRAGARVLRGGAFKPRTSPYSFQGLGAEGLGLLADAGRANGMPVVTEVTSPDLVPVVSEHADILQVGARNMQNYALLEAVGRVRTPVLLKRGLMSTVKELLLAAEYILSNGNSQVMLCERGIRTFETSTRNTLDLGAVAVIKQVSHLPVIVDPSHAAGKRPFVGALARAAVAAGADGLIVEVHPRPEEALSDGAQSLTPEEFSELMDQLRAIAAAMGRSMSAGADAPRAVAEPAPRAGTPVS